MERAAPVVALRTPPTLTIVHRTGPSIRSQLLAGWLRLTAKPLLATWSRIPLVSWPTDLVDQAARMLPAPRGASYDRVALAHCAAELPSPAGAVAADRRGPDPQARPPEPSPGARSSRLARWRRSARTRSCCPTPS